MARVATVNNVDEPLEAGDRWVLPLSGHRVERLCFDFAMTVLFSGGFESRIVSLPGGELAVWLPEPGEGAG